MSESYPLRYPNVIPAGSILATNNGVPVFTPDHSQLEFLLQFDGTANYNVQVFTSFQDTPPDISLAVSTTNEYAPCSYQDQDSLVTYSNAFPFNPSTSNNGGAYPAGTKAFKLNTNGARWVIIQTTNRTTGTVVKLDVALFPTN